MPIPHLRRLERRFDLQEYLKQFDPKDFGPNVAIRCPHCDRDEKLWVLLNDRRDSDGEMRYAGSFICYYCFENAGEGAGHGPLQLIQWVEDVEFVEALKLLAQGAAFDRELDFVQAVVEALTKTESDEDDDEYEMPTIELPEGFRRITERRRPRYLKERGISVKRAQRYGMGYCERGYYFNRLIVPIYLDKKLVSFAARFMKRKPPEGIKKTLFPRGCKTGRMLYNYDVARRCKRVIMVEDVFSASAIGKNAVCTFGTSLSQYQLELLLYARCEEIVVIWDHDAIEKAYKLVEGLQEFWKVRIVELPDSRDPDEHRRKDLRQFIGDAQPVTAYSAFAGLVRERLKHLPI